MVVDEKRENACQFRKNKSRTEKIVRAWSRIARKPGGLPRPLRSRSRKTMSLQEFPIPVTSSRRVCLQRVGARQEDSTRKNWKTREEMIRGGSDPIPMAEHGGRTGSTANKGKSRYRSRRRRHRRRCQRQSTNNHSSRIVARIVATTRSILRSGPDQDVRDKDSDFAQLGEGFSREFKERKKKKKKGELQHL